MKKRFLLPCLLLVASLSACGGAGGDFVSGGSAYKEGDAAKVDAALRAEKEDKVKQVTEKMNSSVSYDVNYNGQAVKSSQKLSGSVKVEVDEKKIEGDFKVNVSSNGQKASQNIKFKGQEIDGYLQFTEGEAEAEAMDLDLDSFYEQATYEIYSWNYIMESEEIKAALDQAEGYGASIGKDFFNKMVINGDPAKGTFDVGLGEKFSFTYQGATFAFTKLKYSYKDCLLQKAVVGFNYSGGSSYDGTTVSVKLNMDATYEFSYVMK